MHVYVHDNKSEARWTSTHMFNDLGGKFLIKIELVIIKSILK